MTQPHDVRLTRRDSGLTHQQKQLIKVNKTAVFSCFKRNWSSRKPEEIVFCSIYISNSISSSKRRKNGVQYEECFISGEMKCCPLLVILLFQRTSFYNLWNKLHGIPTLWGCSFMLLFFIIWLKTKQKCRKDAEKKLNALAKP